MTAITHVNPSGMHTSPAYSQGVIAEAGRTLYVGGQNGTDERGAIEGGVEQQSVRALQNVLRVLEAAGAGPEHVVRLGIYLAPDADPNAAFAATAGVWGPHPTAVTVVRVAGLGRPEALVEIEATALLP